MSVRFKNTVTGKIYTQIYDDVDLWGCPTDRGNTYTLLQARENPDLQEVFDDNLPKGHYLTSLLEEYEAVKDAGGKPGDIFLLLDKRWIITKRNDEHTDNT